MATGPQDAEVSGCFEPLGAEGAVGDGGRRAFGMLGAAVPALPSALRGGWLGKASLRRVPVDKLVWMLGEYRTHHLGWNVKHFHEPIRQQHGFRWGYTWTKRQLHTAGLVERTARRGAHRRIRPRKPGEGLMLHQDGSRFAWLSGAPELDLIVTMDDATSTIYSAFL